MTFQDFDRRKTQWAKFLAEFNFWIIYQQGKSRTKPDSLYCKYGDLPKYASYRRHFY